MQVEGEHGGDVQVALKAPDTHELIARIRARLPSAVQELGANLRIDKKGRSVQKRVGDQWEEIHLQPLEYEVLEVLVDANGAVVGTWELFDRVFQDTVPCSDELEGSSPDKYRNRVWVSIANLRKKIASDGESDYIQTVHGIGYRLRRTPSG